MDPLLLDLVAFELDLLLPDLLLSDLLHSDLRQNETLLFNLGKHVCLNFVQLFYCERVFLVLILNVWSLGPTSSSASENPSSYRAVW